MTETKSTYLYLPNFGEFSTDLEDEAGEYRLVRMVTETFYDDEYQHAKTEYGCLHAQFLEDQIEDVRFAREVRERNAQ